jgi:hypothetical protein
MRWSQGVWSEHRIIDLVNESDNFYAIAYGPSGTAPTDGIREFEEYFERLEAAGLGKIKRPDILIFDSKHMREIDSLIADLGGVKELPFIHENDLGLLLERAMLAVECENSLWMCEKMPDFGAELKPMKRLNGRPGLKKNAVLPTVIIKNEDFEPLKIWEKENEIPIHVWHVFFYISYGLPLSSAVRLLNEGLIAPTVQTYQAPGGATTKKPFISFIITMPMNSPSLLKGRSSFPIMWKTGMATYCLM